MYNSKFEIDYNILLEYISYLKSGTIEQFKHYIDNLDYKDKLQEIKDHNPYTSIITMFSRLGHIEFDYTNRKFSVCPATLVVLSDKKQGVLSGYRTKKFVKDLDGLFQIEVLPNNYAPNIIKIYFGDIDDFKNSFPKIKISEDFSDNLLNIVPTVKDIKANLQEFQRVPIFGQSFVKYYNSKSFKFEFIKNDYIKDGLYEIDNSWYKDYYLRKNNKWYQIDMCYGKFLIHSYENKKTLRYSNGALYLNSHLRFPELIDRALTMYSGKNPSWEKSELKYDIINKNIANNVAKLLGQYLEV